MNKRIKWKANCCKIKRLTSSFFWCQINKMQFALSMYETCYLEKGISFGRRNGKLKLLLEAFWCYYVNTKCYVHIHLLLYTLYAIWIHRKSSFEKWFQKHLWNMLKNINVSRMALVANIPISTLNLLYVPRNCLPIICSLFHFKLFDKMSLAKSVVAFYIDDKIGKQLISFVGKFI